MPEETKGNPRALQPPADAAAKPAAPAPAAAAKPAAPAPAAAAKPAVPAKPAGPVPEPWNAPLPTGLKSRFGSAVKEASTYLGQNYLVVDRAVVIEVLHILCDEEQFDYCVDITAVHYPKKELQFEIVWILYSFARNQRMRVKTQIKDGAPAPSVVAIWPAANWLERECFDMFGITFEGHPDLRRILLPDGWKGYPLRKEYSILLQDKEWVQANLGIESGQ
jgi:NADH-quinone oxidoreductase subunit C